MFYPLKIINFPFLKNVVGVYLHHNQAFASSCTSSILCSHCVVLGVFLMMKNEIHCKLEVCNVSV